MIYASVPEGGHFGIPEPGYRWICGMCRGVGLVEDIEEDGKLAGCPKCALAREYGVAFELVRRNIAPATTAFERLASPAIEASSFIYEVWQFFVEEGTARRVAAEDDLGAAYTAKWDLEEATYGPLEKWMGS